MCRLVEIETSFGTTCKVADIKEGYIKNILKNARACTVIEKIILFGSVITEECTDKSDIDIAIFGNDKEMRVLRSREYREFTSQIYNYGEFQDYDILYFELNREQKSNIMSDINQGTVIYRKEGVA